VSVNKPDISQIEKYLNGELDARAMHNLERQALDDPFLADALEGYAQKKASSTTHLQDLNSRLQQRIKPEAKRLGLWITLSIAATILVFVSVGSWYWFVYQRSAQVKSTSPADNTEVAKVMPAPVSKHTPGIVQPELKPAGPQWVATKPHLRNSHTKKSILTDTKTNNLKSAMADSINNGALLGRTNLIVANGNDKQKSNITSGYQLSDAVVVGYGTQSKKSITGASETLVKPKSIESALNSKVAGISVTANEGTLGSSNGIQIRGMSSISKDKHPLLIVDGKPVNKIDTINPDAIASIEVLKDASATAIYGSRAANGVIIIKTKETGLINGQVISADDKVPIPGVIVKVKGTNKTVQTNAEGKFAIDADKNTELIFASVGFDTQELKPKGTDSLKVTLQADHRSLAEVAVVGYGRRSGSERASRQSLDTAALSKKQNKAQHDKKAHPVHGWKEFNNSIKNQAKSPDGKTGVVRLSFVVNADNTVTDIKIIKSLSAEADAKAVELVKNYRGWVAKADGDAETIKVKIRFSK